MSLPRKWSVREHIFLGLTRSLCSVCGQVVDAQVLLRDGALYLRKRCPGHGWQEALVLSDADWALQGAKYHRAGAVPYDFASAVDRGCPHDCGLCPEHQQHTCIGLIEVTSRCDLACPVCFADAGDPSRLAEEYDLSLAQVDVVLDRFVETEGRPEVLQISGGEPTAHPQILDILDAAKGRGIRHVMLNTNGLRIANDPGFVEKLTRYEPSIYLQFDGMREATYRTLRGRDLTALKLQALDHLSRTDMVVILVATVAQGVNDDEIADILHFALDHPAVLGVAFQPVTYAGRCFPYDPLHRVTLTDVLHGLEAGTGGLFRRDDFRPVPCPHPICSACTYAFVDDSGSETQVLPIPRLIEVDDYLDVITNRAAPSLSDEMHGALQSLWSSAATMGADETTESLACVACSLDVSLPIGPEALKRRFFMVQLHGFMDKHTFDLRRLMKCCVHQLLPDGRAVPFCAYNVLGYREEVRDALRAEQRTIEGL